MKFSIAKLIRSAIPLALIKEIYMNFSSTKFLCGAMKLPGNFNNCVFVLGIVSLLFAAPGAYASFVNSDFEIGAANSPPPSWTIYSYLNPGVTIQSPQTKAGLNLAAGGVSKTVELTTTAGP